MMFGAVRFVTGDFERLVMRRERSIAHQAADEQAPHAFLVHDERQDAR